VAEVDIINMVVEMIIASRLIMKMPPKELRLIFSERSWWKNAKR